MTERIKLLVEIDIEDDNGYDLQMLEFHYRDMLEQLVLDQWPNKKNIVLIDDRV